MKKITNLVKGFLADEKGAETVEWVMVAAVLAGIIMASLWGTLKGGLDTAITTLTGKMNTAGTAPAG